MKTRNKILKSTAIAALFLIMLSGGCKDQNVGVDGVCPVVLSTDPVNLATGIPPNQIITITFNEALAPETINANAFSLQSPPAKQTKTIGSNDKEIAPETNNEIAFGITSPSVKEANTNSAKSMVSAVIPGTVTYNATTRSMIFTPTNDLPVNTTFTGTVATSVKDPNGNALQTPYVFTFSTGTIPAITLTDPLDGDIDVALDKVISATFSQAMNAATLSNAFSLMMGTTVVNGVVDYSGMIATFTPDVNLLSDTSYTVTITTDVLNTSGIAIESDSVWSFSTVAPLGPVVVALNSLEEFGIIAGVGVSNNAGFSEIHDMNVGISPGVRSSITGFPPAIVVNGAIYASDDASPVGIATLLIQAKQDLVDAYDDAFNATTPAPAVAPADLGGTTLAPGIYTSATTMLLQNGDLTLDAQGDANAVWIFQIGSSFTSVGIGPFPSPTGGNVILAGNAQAKNVFWVAGASATIGDFTDFKGNILALSDITMNSGAEAEGRMLARNGSVVMTNTNIINKP